MNIFAIPAVLLLEMHSSFHRLNTQIARMAQVGDGPLSGLVTGYPKLAGQMGILPESAMFRTFAALNARNLLYLQAELVALENALLQCEIDDAKDEKRCQYALDWFWLHQSQWDEETSKQYNLIHQIKEKLKEYSL
jgi:hypothetical protein